MWAGCSDQGKLTLTRERSRTCGVVLVFAPCQVLRSMSCTWLRPLPLSALKTNRVFSLYSESLIMSEISGEDTRLSLSSGWLLSQARLRSLPRVDVFPLYRNRCHTGKPACDDGRRAGMVRAVVQLRRIPCRTLC